MRMFDKESEFVHNVIMNSHYLYPIITTLIWIVISLFFIVSQQREDIRYAPPSNPFEPYDLTLQTYRASNQDSSNKYTLLPLAVFFAPLLIASLWLAIASSRGTKRISVFLRAQILFLAIAIPLFFVFSRWQISKIPGIGWGAFAIFFPNLLYVTICFIVFVISSSVFVFRRGANTPRPHAS